MPLISIDYNVDNLQFVLSGEIKELKKNRYIMRYMKDYLNPIINDDEVLIPIQERSIEETLSEIQDMLEEYGFDENKSNKIQEMLIDYFVEDSNFKQFSLDAQNIRNNLCVAEDFNSFQESVKKNLKNRELYTLQLLSAYHLAFSQNACNFSVPGAGKTSIVYGAYTYLKNLEGADTKKVDKILIVSPLSAFGPWELEYLECFGEVPTVQRINSNIGKEQKTLYFYSKNTAEITLISYASLASVKDDVSFFLRNNRTMVVLDEAHRIKNTSGGIIASAVLDISRYAKSRVVLTGTPAPNGYEDLYNMYKFIWPTKDIIKYKINQLRDMSGQRSDLRVTDLINSISPFFIRIKKSDLGIPRPINNPPILVEMGDSQRKIYDYIEKKYMDTLLKDTGLNLSTKFRKALVNAKLIRLMQAASNPAMLNGPLSDFLNDEEIPLEAYRAIDDSDFISLVINYADSEVPAKFLEARKIIKEIIENGGTVVVWATFIKTIHDFQSFLKTEGINAQILYGATPVNTIGIDDDSDEEGVLTREKIIKDFHDKNCSYKVIIANPSAVAESISLHKACHNAIYLERTFNAAHFIQSKDRIHRYGLSSETKTNYYYLISKDSIDEVIDERLFEKEKRMIEIMETMPIPLFENATDELGDDDIKVLIQKYVRKTKRI